MTALRRDRIAHALELRRRYHVAAVRAKSGLAPDAARRAARRAWLTYAETMLSAEERGWVLSQWAHHVCPGTTCPLAVRRAS